MDTSSGERGTGAVWGDLLSGSSAQARESIETLLDGLAPEPRVALLRRTRPQHLRALFELCSEQPLVEDHLVPELAPEPGDTVHDGVNSLPLFRVFQKRFFRSEDGSLAGYNPSPFNWAVTPGYFTVCREGENLFFDYTKLPMQVPPGWPPPIPNSRKLGRFVYHGLRDDMRRVSRHVCIGAVRRHGRPIDTWFVLCRRE